MEPLKIFYSYAHKDKTLRGELGKHLSSYRHRGICQDWFDGDIGAGDEWDDAIKEKLQSSDFILLLISADFLASKYIRSVELDIAMRRHQAKDARVIPIVLRSCDFSGEVFSKLQALPAEMKPVDLWPNQDAAWTDVVKALAVQFEKFRKTTAEPEAPAGPGEATNGSSAPAMSPPPKSNEMPAPPGERLSVAEEKNRALAWTSTEAFQGLSELMANPKIKASVAQEQTQLMAADEALQVLVDYKNVHDRLHDLQFKCYNYIFQEGRKLEDQVDWPLLVQPQKDLRGIVRALQKAAQQKSMAEEDFAWLDSLLVAADRFDKGCEDLSIAPLQESGKIIRGVLEMRPTIFDTKLCAAARTLPLDELRAAMSSIRGKLSAGAIGSDAGQRFSLGVEALPKLSSNLQVLTAEHTRWQVIATTFWSIDALIDQSVDVLRNSWQKLRERLERICTGNTAKWAVAILESVSKLEQLLSTPAPAEEKALQRWQTRIRVIYKSCSNDGGRRFYQVDLSLKHLCDELRNLQMALAKMLQELP